MDLLKTRLKEQEEEVREGRGHVTSLQGDKLKLTSQLTTCNEQLLLANNALTSAGKKVGAVEDFFFFFGFFCCGVFWGF